MSDFTTTNFDSKQARTRSIDKADRIFDQDTSQNCANRLLLISQTESSFHKSVLKPVGYSIDEMSLQIIDASRYESESLTTMPSSFTKMKYDANLSMFNFEKNPTLWYKIFIKSYRIPCHAFVEIFCGLICVSILLYMGLFLKAKQDGIRMFSVPYSSLCESSFPFVCRVPVQFNCDIFNNKVYLFLKVSNMPQAIKEFTERFSSSQLRNKDTSSKDLHESCGNSLYINKIIREKGEYQDDEYLNNKPCGYLPSTFPMDRFINLIDIYEENTMIEVKSDEIISKTAAKHRYNFDGQPFVSSPQFQNWMVS